MKIEQKKKIFKIFILIFLLIITTISVIFYAEINKNFAIFFQYQFKVFEQKDNMIVHFIYIGQGDGIVINLPDGKIVVIDCGPETYATDFTNYINTNVLNNRRNKTIDYLILSHADEDHCGGALKLVSNFQILNAVIPVVESSANYYHNIISKLNTSKTNLIKANEINNITNGYKIEFFGPSNEGTTTNDSSLIVKVSYLTTSFLFTGDISENVEDDFVNKYGNKLDSDVLKVSHHGSKYSTTEDFLSCVSPKFGIISCGVDNSYKHPNQEVLDRLDEYNVKILRTDLNGNIAFSVSNDYSLKYLTGSYRIVGELIDYRLIVSVLDVSYIIIGIWIFIKKENKHLTHTF